MIPADFLHASWFAAAYSGMRNLGLDPSLFELASVQETTEGRNTTWTITCRHTENNVVGFFLTLGVATQDPQTILHSKAEYRLGNEKLRFPAI